MTSVTAHRTVVVVGGGVTGLAAAYELSNAEPATRVILLEGGDRLGGKVRATPFAGLPSVECGADMFLARTPAAVELAGDLGLAGDLVAPVSLPAYVWSRGRLHALPPGLVLGAPARLGPMARSRLLSWRGKARAAVEPLLPRWHPAGDEADTLGLAVRARFGDEVLDRLVGPLIGGINAGDPDHLSLRAVTPQLAEALAEHRSLLIGLRAQAARRGRAHRWPGPAQPVPRPAGRRERPRRSAAHRDRGGRRRGAHRDRGGHPRAPGRPVDGPARGGSGDRGRRRGAHGPRPGRGRACWDT